MGLNKKTSGYTLVELVIGMSVLAIVTLAVMGLFTTLANSAAVTKRKAIALTLATNQMEYLKSLPYDSLAVAGGSIYSPSPLPNTVTQTYNGTTYTIKTSINYVDDAYDGCGSYPTQALKELYCRNYPPPSGAPATDSNPADYKIAHVSAYAPATRLLAEVDTQISARVAETASTTGALFVTIVDASGAPVSGATAQVTNATLSPNINVSDTTDSNGVAIFYGLPPDTGFDYTVTASKSGYSSLTTIAASGALQPTYPKQQILTQSSSSVTLTIKPQGADSLLVETTNTSGTPLANVKVNIKGGYKKYTSTADTTYYYDTMSPSDTRPTTDASGFVGVGNLVPGTYLFCGDAGATSCQVGGTTYYLAAAIPYSGNNALNPVAVPTYEAASPPATTFAYGGVNYYQKVRLMLTTSSSYPRVRTLSPGEASLAEGLSSFAFTITGNNLPCSASASSCSTTVRLLQGASTFTASCTGNSSGLQLNCTANLSAAAVGPTQLQIVAGGNTLTLPASPLKGGVDVTP